MGNLGWGFPDSPAPSGADSAPTQNGPRDLVSVGERRHHPSQDCATWTPPRLPLPKSPATPLPLSAAVLQVAVGLLLVYFFLFKSGTEKSSPELSQAIVW